MADNGFFVARQKIEVKYIANAGGSVCRGIDWAQRCSPNISDFYELHARGTTSEEALANLRTVIEGNCDGFVTLATTRAECKSIDKPVVYINPLHRFAIAVGDCAEELVDRIKRAGSL